MSDKGWNEAHPAHLGELLKQQDEKAKCAHAGIIYYDDKHKRDTQYKVSVYINQEIVFIGCNVYKKKDILPFIKIINKEWGLVNDSETHEVISGTNRSETRRCHLPHRQHET